MIISKMLCYYYKIHSELDAKLALWNMNIANAYSNEFLFQIPDVNLNVLMISYLFDKYQQKFKNDSTHF